jgi:hypothetical protein
MLLHPRPRLPVGGEFSPVYIPVGEETSPSLSPNRGIPRGESGIGSPLPSLVFTLADDVGAEMVLGIIILAMPTPSLGSLRLSAICHVVPRGRSAHSSVFL